MLGAYSVSGRKLVLVFQALGLGPFRIRGGAEAGLLGSFSTGGGSLGSGCSSLPPGIFLTPFGGQVGSLALLHDADTARVFGLLGGFAGICVEFLVVPGLEKAAGILHVDGSLRHHVGSIEVRALSFRDGDGFASFTQLQWN